MKLKENLIVSTQNDLLQDILKLSKVNDKKKKKFKGSQGIKAGNLLRYPITLSADFSPQTL